jgi:hypothetical protein
MDRKTMDLLLEETVLDRISVCAFADFIPHPNMKAVLIGRKRTVFAD